MIFPNMLKNNNKNRKTFIKQCYFFSLFDENKWIYSLKKVFLMNSKIESNKNSYFNHLIEKTKYNNGLKF